MTGIESSLDARRGVFPAVLDDPHADASTEPFWDAAKQDRLVAAKCTNCGTFRLPPYPYCWVCRQQGVEWIDLPGTGVVYTYTVIRHPLSAQLADVVPYAVGMIELDGTQGAGARLQLNITDCNPDTIAIGAPVRVYFEHIDETMSVPRCRPIASEGA